MPYLSQTDRENYARATRRVCSDCGQVVWKEYCSRCDEFWEAQHSPGCVQIDHEKPHTKETCGGDRGEFLV